jgi:hypothetical protein
VASRGNSFLRWSIDDDGQAFVAPVNAHNSSLGRIDSQQGPRHSGLDLVRDEPPQRARSVDRVESLLGDELQGCRADLQTQAVLSQTLPEIGQQVLYDLLDLGKGQWLEHDHIVEPVEEFRPEPQSKFTQDAFAGIRLDLTRIAGPF